jgi:hypothetical protein
MILGVSLSNILGIAVSFCSFMEFLAVVSVVDRGVSGIVKLRVKGHGLTY